MVPWEFASIANIRKAPLADRWSFSEQSAIIQIIEEEISGYNAGVLTAEQTMVKIQNRVQLYWTSRNKCYKSAHK